MIPSLFRTILIAGIAVFFLADEAHASSRAESMISGEGTGTTIQNNVSASATTGGNTGETVKTGDARATSSSTVEMNAGEKTQVSVEATSEANGDKATIKLEAPNASGEDTSLKQEETNGGAIASGEINISNAENKESEKTKVDTDFFERFSRWIKNIFNFWE